MLNQIRIELRDLDPTLDRSTVSVILHQAVDAVVSVLDQHDPDFNEITHVSISSRLDFLHASINRPAADDEWTAKATVEIRH